jgi:hypothetical protein
MSSELAPNLARSRARAEPLAPNLVRSRAPSLVSSELAPNLVRSRALAPNHSHQTSSVHERLQFAKQNDRENDLVPDQ